MHSEIIVLSRLVPTKTVLLTPQAVRNRSVTVTLIREGMLSGLALIYIPEASFSYEQAQCRGLSFHSLAVLIW